jgi:cytochrome d ubiquinol oxidase subunit II
MGIELSVIWAVIILFSIMMYIIMDGFDLGLGILFPFFKDKEDRDIMMHTVAPVWDGNETWLVLGGAGLLAAFPLAYSVILSALYLPIILMLIGLIFRGVAFEFRFKALDHERHFWDKAFIGGSVCATFFQGVTLGAYIQGIPVVDRAYAGGALDWLTWFSVFTGLGLVVAFALLGSTWLIIKTEGALQERAHKISGSLAWLLLATMIVISVWTPLMHEKIAARWFTLPNLFWFSPVPFLVGVFTFLLLRSVKNRNNLKPFIFTLGLIFLGYSGLGISVWPNIIPPDISIWQAASPPQSQGFVLVGALFIIPIILVYTFWAYYVFRGKVNAGMGYHH